MEPQVAAGSELAPKEEGVHEEYTVESLPLTVLTKLLSMLPGNEVLRAAEVSKDFYAASLDVQDLRVELNATRDMLGSAGGQGPRFQRRVDSFLLWLERGNGPRLAVLAHGARLLHSTAQAALASTPAAGAALVAWTKASNAAAVAATSASAAAVAKAQEGRAVRRGAAPVAMVTPFELGPEAFSAWEASSPAPSGVGASAAAAGPAEWQPPLPNLQLLIVTERTAHAIQLQHRTNGPLIWGVLCGAGAAPHGVRVIGRPDDPLVATYPVLGPAHSLWVPSIPHNAPGIAPICKLMGGPLLPWRARIVEISNSSMVRVNYIPPHIHGVQVAYPDWMVLKAPTLSFGRTFSIGGGPESETTNHARQLCAASKVRVVYNHLISNEPTATDKARLAAVMEECKMGSYDEYGGKDKCKSEWTFWF